MSQEAYHKIWKMIGLRYQSHPWHGIEIGPQAPHGATCFIEVIPTDTVKYEVDKRSGYLMIDRPQKSSNIVPALYGFIPQTYCKEQVAAYCRAKTGLEGITGDDDPLDICVLTEREVTHVYGKDEAHEVIRRSQADYREKFGNLEDALSLTLFEAFNAGKKQQDLLRDL